jgi:FtsH-binding integral membrane protein
MRRKSSFWGQIEIVLKATYDQVLATPATTIIQQAFAWMFGGLMVTAFTAMFAAGSPEFLHALMTQPLLFYGLIGGELALVFGISMGINRLAPPVAVALYLTYALLNGLTLSSIFVVYTGESIGAAFISASLAFGIMAVFGYVTKKDLSSIGSLAFMGLIGLIVASVVNMFLRNDMVSYLLSYGAILIFTVLTAYDTQKLKRMSQTMGGGNLGIYGALALYLDFINIFLSLLRIFGGRRN